MSRRWADVSACVVTWARRRPWCVTHGRYFGVCGIPEGERCKTCLGQGSFPNGADRFGIHCLSCDGTGRKPEDPTHD